MKSHKKLAIEAQADQNLLVEAIENLPEQVIKNVETIGQHQDRHQQNTKTDDPQAILEVLQHNSPSSPPISNSQS